MCSSDLRGAWGPAAGLATVRCFFPGGLPAILTFNFLVSVEGVGRFCPVSLMTSLCCDSFSGLAGGLVLLAWPPSSVFGRPLDG